MNKTILILPILIALFFSIALYLKSSKKDYHFKILGNYFILYVILFGSMTVVGMFNNDSSIANFVAISSFLFFTISITIPPTFYLYVVYLSDLKNEKLKHHYYLPLLLLIINCISFTSFLVNTDENSYTHELVSSFATAANLIAILFIFPIQNVYYIFKTIKIYQHHKIEINKVFSYKNGVDLRWMLHYILGYVIFIIGLYLTQLVPKISLHIPIRIFLSAYFLYIGIKGLKQYKVTFKEDINTTSDNKGEKAISSDELKQKIVNAMTTNELFLDSELTVHKLAKTINSNSKYISNIINTELNQNFAAFINTYRIEKAKGLLIDPDYDNYTIEAISKEVGFNSKSAFNIAFKKITNQTPSIYRKDG